jgi:hypothetical protein
MTESYSTIIRPPFSGVVRSTVPECVTAKCQPHAVRYSCGPCSSNYAAHFATPLPPTIRLALARARLCNRLINNGQSAFDRPHFRSGARAPPDNFDQVRASKQLLYMCCQLLYVAGTVNKTVDSILYPIQC